MRSTASFMGITPAPGRRWLEHPGGRCSWCHSLVVAHPRQSCAARVTPGPGELERRVGSSAETDHAALDGEALVSDPADRLDQHHPLGGLDPLVQRLRGVVLQHRYRAL